MQSLHELMYWNNNCYGRAIRVPRLALISAFITICIITPFTNWMIPFAGKWVKNDIVVRY